MLDIKITRTTSPKEKPDENNLGFGKKFTDHMFVMDYTEGPILAYIMQRFIVLFPPTQTYAPTDKMSMR